MTSWPPVHEVSVLNALRSETVARPLRVLAAGAVKSVVEDVFAGRSSTGEAIETVFDTVGALAVSAVGRREIAMAGSQATEILPRTEVTFLGFFPESCQIWTSYRAVALPGHPAAAGVIDALARAKGAAALRRAGFT